MLLKMIGSLPFAIALIAATVIFVIAGTFIESATDSHELAAHFTYHNPLFVTLLWLYFFNILFSALMRWPFQKKHIAFLVTHAGLLMILAGVLIKNHFGVQGAMGIAEGGHAHSILLPHTFALQVESPDQLYQIPLKAGQSGPLPSPITPLELELLAWNPHLSLRARDPHGRGEYTIPFDEHATSLSYPILEGRYLVRFQSQAKEIPFAVRLKKARLINYPGTEQAYSYESDLLIDREPVTLSMNHVFEKRGYRFYLANIARQQQGASWIKIVVNRDPAKYWLTYPGGIVLALGIGLLYFRKAYV